MKRIISLVLAIALLCSFVPVALAETATPALSFELGEVATKTYTPYGGSETTYYSVPVSVKNNSTDRIKISTYECYLKFDGQSLNAVTSTELEDGTYIRPVTNGERPRELEWGLPTAGVSYHDSNCFGVATANNSDATPITVNAGTSVVLFWANFVAAPDAEKGLRTIQFAKDSRRSDGALAINFATYYDKGSDTTTDYSEAAGTLTCTNETTVNVISGTTPVLTRAEIVAEDGKLETAYGTSKVFTLKAYSAKNTDLSENVTWTVSPSEGIEISGTMLTVSDAAAVAEYTVTAKTKDTDKCVDGETPATATFKVTPATITNPTVTITGFGKGQPVDKTAATADNMTVACSWYTGEGTPSEGNAASGNFAVSTTYTLVLTLTPVSGNYALAENTSVTVNGLDGQKTASLAISGNSGVALVTGTTGAKDKTMRASGTNLSARSATFGDTLNTVDIVAEANKDGYLVVAYIDGKETTVKVPGEFEWETPTDKVGEVGENRHKVIFKPDKPYDEIYEGFDAFVRFTVTKKVLNLDETNWTWSSTNLTYTGEAQSVTVTPPNDIAEFVTVTYDNETEGYTNTATNAGSYTAAAVVTPKEANNISLGGKNAEEQASRTFTKAWTISKADLTPTNAEESVIYGTEKVTVTLADLGLNQSGIEISAVDSTTSETKPLITGTQISEDKQSVEFTLRSTSVNDANDNVQATATVTFTSQNYNVANATVTIKIVDKTPVTLNVDGSADSFPYGTTADDIEKTLAITNAPAGVKLTYTYTDAAGNTVRDISKADPDEGYVVTISGQDDEFAYTGTHTFKITKLDLANATIEADGDPLVYTGNELTQNVTVKYNGNLITASHYTVKNNTRTNAGKQTLTVEATESSAYYIGSKTFEFTIAKATPTVDDFDFRAPANLTYDGNPKTASVTTTNTEIGAVTVSYDPAVPTNAGQYTVSINVAESNNYNAATLSDDSWKFNIAPAQITEAMVGSIGDLTYTGEAQTPTLSVARLTAGTDYEVTYTNNTDAGTATATVTGEGNYTGTVVRNFTINPASMIFVKNVYVSRRTNVHTEQTIRLQIITGVKGETLTPTVTLEAPSSADNIFKVAPAYDATTGSVTFTLNGTAGSATYKVKLASPNSNYAPGEYNLVITASDRTAIAITFEDGSATYTGKPIRYENASVSVGESGTWTYTYAPLDGSGASLDTTTGLPLTVGTYKVTARFESANYIGTQTVTFVIEKATPATPPEIKVDGGDKKLSDLEAGMRAAMGNIAGDFKWYDSNGNELTASTTTIEANKEYTWRFIPDDLNNYNPTEGRTTPYVQDDLSWLPGVINGGSSFSFHDVNRFDYYYDSVKWAADNGIASGTSRFAFSPDAVCTRAQTVTFLWRAAGSPLPRYRVSPFTDVHSYDYYYEAVLWAVEQGITTGLTATTFGPDETVTRGQVATFLYRAASAAKPNTFNPFTDVKPTAYNYDAILWAYDNRITTGTSTTTFSPDAFCTRAQIVTFLYRYYQGR